MNLRSPLIPRFSATAAPLESTRLDTLIVPLWERFDADSLKGLGEALATSVGDVRELGEFEGKYLEQATLYRPAGLDCKQVLLLGLGNRDSATPRSVQDAAASALFELSKKPRDRVGILLPPAPANRSAREMVLDLGIGAAVGCYSGGLFQAKPSRSLPGEIPFLTTLDLTADLERLRVEAEAVARCRELVNLPPADLYPESFADLARALSAEAGIDCEVWEPERLEQERMGGILGVAKGSDRPARFVILRYRGAGDAPFFAWVGKGVTFDSGGMSMKTTDQMIDMKCDMAGAATVLSALRAVAELKVPVNLLGCLPLVENMVNGRSMKLGDVLTARNGKTIEVLNTDAEGRLILADALSYAVEQKVSGIIDLATLTGACMVALGSEIAGLMSNSDPLTKQVHAAIQRAGERAWSLPMDVDFDDLLKSKIADIKNVAGHRYGGAIVAAKFLQHFVGETPWVHLDIAGPAYTDHESGGREAGGTGVYVRSLIELAHDRRADRS
jgi:leucyl aminopeptidase